jgi:hypothetical protein
MCGPTWLAVIVGRVPKVRETRGSIQRLLLRLLPEVRELTVANSLLGWPSPSPGHGLCMAFAPLFKPPST